MSDITGITNLTATSAGDTSLTGIKAAVGNLNTGKVETSVTVNGHALSSNIAVTNSDLGAVPTTTTVNSKALSSNITLGLASSDFANQGTTTTVLHGSASGNPSFAPVVELDFTFSDNTTADVSTSKHGLVPKAPNDTTKFLRGDGTWNSPGGGVFSYVGTLFSDTNITTTKNTDTVYPTGFTPKVITLYYFLLGYTTGGAQVKSYGTSVFNGTAISGNIFAYESLAAASSVTPNTGGGTATNPTAGAGTGSGIIVTASVNSISGTNFVIRIASTQAAANTGEAKYSVVAHQ